jgi:glycine/D-amino acid oxidase-like deaminating enzyme
VEAEVVVVGAGIAGLSVAYELVKAGWQVVVLDRGLIGGGMTARTSGHLSFESDDYYEALIRLRGEDEARQYHDSQKAAVDRIEAIALEEGIDCDFARVDAYLIAASADDRDLLDTELAACRRWVSPGWRSPTRRPEQHGYGRLPALPRPGALSSPQVRAGPGGGDPARGRAASSATRR